MDRIRGLVGSLLDWLRPGRVGRELDEEFRYHIEREAEKLMAEGVEPAEARRRAGVRFGGVERTREAVRDAQGPRWVEELVLDVRHSARSLRRTPVVALVAVVSLGLGIGGITTVFSVANAFLWADPGGPVSTEGLVALYTSDPGGRLYGETSFPDYVAIRETVSSLEDMAAYRLGVVNLGDGEGRERIIVELVTDNFFDMLGVRPALGRAFEPDEARIGSAARVIVLSHRAWLERFDGDPAVLGREIRLDGHPFTVIGVMPEGLEGRYLRILVEGWVPLGIPGGTYHATPQELTDRADRDYNVAARLTPGTPFEEARAEMDVIASRLRASYPDAWEEDGRPRVLTLLTEADARIPPDGRMALTGLAAFVLGGALMILLLVCSNVAGVLLARATRRGREIAVRASLGAGRARLARLLLTESTMLAVAGGGLGILLAVWASRYFGTVRLPIAVPLRFDIILDRRVLAFATGVTVLAALGAGLMPALRGSRAALMSALRSDADRSVRGSRIRGALVALQVTVAGVLLIGTGLAARSLQSGLALGPGMDIDDVAVMWLEPPAEIAGDSAGTLGYFLAQAERLRSRPEVEAATLANTAERHPMMEGSTVALVSAGNEAPAPVAYAAVTPGYLDMVGLDVRQGRDLQESDAAGAPRVAIVNEAFVRRHWPGSDGVGQRIRVTRWLDFGQPTEANAVLEVVGVVADRAVAGRSPVPAIWTSFLQQGAGRAVLHARGGVRAASLVPVLREAVSVPPDLVPLFDPTPYSRLVDLQFAGHRLLARVMAGAGVFALILAVLGVYGVVSFMVGMRVREMAIRQALGAARRQVLASLVRGGMRSAVAGLVAGTGLAVALAFAVRSELYGLSPLDPPALLIPLAVLAGSALVASVIPARRLLRVEPMDVLRDE